MLPLKNSVRSYGLLARILHWTSVALLVTVIILAEIFDSLDAGDEKTDLVVQHTSYGLVLFGVMLIRLYWRLTNINPVKSYTIRAWQKFTATFLHYSIYFVVLSQCLTGLLNTVFSGLQIRFFGLFELPALMNKQQQASELLFDLHVFTYYLIYPLFAIHISAAIYHQIFGVVDE